MSFVISLPANPTQDQIDALQEIMDASQDAYFAECDKIQKDLGVSSQYANAICYLRTRSRWTQSLEDNLIEMCKLGEPCPNINEYGHPPFDIVKA